MDKKTIIISSVITVICLGILCCLVPIEQKRALKEEWGEIAVLAETDEKAAYIIENKELYPPDVLWVYYNCQNPDRLDFVYNYPFYINQPRTVAFTEDELNCTEVPAIYMNDLRWCYDKVGENFIYVDGCVTVALTMANLYLNHNDAVDPVKVADYATQNDLCSPMGGIFAEQLPQIFKHFNIEFIGHNFDLDNDVKVTEDELKAALDKDDTVVYAGMTGDTFGYHAIIIRGYDENGFYVNDPEVPEITSKVWDFETIQNEMALFYELYTK